MPTTRYFDEQVMRKRSYVTVELCMSVIEDPLRSEIQPDGRQRFWGEVVLPGEARTRILRVVTLEDGITVHNAFLDRDFEKDRP